MLAPLVPGSNPDSAYEPLPLITEVVPARYAWEFAKPQKLSWLKPIFVPVTGLPETMTLALKLGSLEFVGPAHHR